MRPLDSSSRTKGFVLVNALVIVAAMAAAATLLLSRAEGGRVRLVAAQEADVLIHALDAFETLGRSILDRDQHNGTIDTLNEAWARATLDVPLEQGRVSGKIMDQQALFNLNWLANADDTLAQEGWHSLLTRIGFSTLKGDAITRFLSPEGPTNGDAYSRLNPPIAPLGGTIMMLDQLTSLIELEPSDIDILRRHVTVLPTTSQVNINTASIHVLAAMLPQISVARLNAVILRRQKDPYPTTDAFFDELGISTDPADPEAVNPARYMVGSNWFTAEITATLGPRRASRRVLLRRESPPLGTQVEWRVSQFQ